MKECDKDGLLNPPRNTETVTVVSEKAACLTVSYRHCLDAMRQHQALPPNPKPQP